MARRVLALYGDRVVPFDLPTARRWGALSAALGNDSADLMIAATALEHGLSVVTGNSSDFEPTGVAVIAPFSRRSGRKSSKPGERVSPRRFQPFVGEQPHRGVGVHRFAERKALGVFAAELIEFDSVRIGLVPLGDHVQAEVVRER